MSKKAIILAFIGFACCAKQGLHVNAMLNNDDEIVESSIVFNPGSLQNQRAQNQLQQQQIKYDFSEYYTKLCQQFQGIENELKLTQEISNPEVFLSHAADIFGRLIEEEVLSSKRINANTSMQEIAQNWILFSPKMKKIVGECAKAYGSHKKTAQTVDWFDNVLGAIVLSGLLSSANLLEYSDNLVKFVTQLNAFLTQYSADTNIIKEFRYNTIEENALAQKALSKIINTNEKECSYDKLVQSANMLYDIHVEKIRGFAKDPSCFIAAGMYQFNQLKKQQSFSKFTEYFIAKQYIFGGKKAIDIYQNDFQQIQKIHISKKIPASSQEFYTTPEENNAVGLLLYISSLLNRNVHGKLTPIAPEEIKKLIVMGIQRTVTAKVALNELNDFHKSLSDNYEQNKKLFDGTILRLTYNTFIDQNNIGNAAETLVEFSEITKEGIRVPSINIILNSELCTPSNLKNLQQVLEKFTTQIYLFINGEYNLEDLEAIAEAFRHSTKNILIGCRNLDQIVKSKQIIKPGTLKDTYLPHFFKSNNRHLLPGFQRGFNQLDNTYAKIHFLSYSALLLYAEKNQEILRIKTWLNRHDERAIQEKEIFGE